MRMILDTLPTAPSAMTILTEILERRSRSLSMRTQMGMRTKVQSATTFSVPNIYPVARINAVGKHFLEPSNVSAILAGSPHAKIVVRT